MLNFQLLKELAKPVFFDVTHSLQQPGALEKALEEGANMFSSLQKLEFLKR